MEKKKFNIYSFLVSHFETVRSFFAVFLALLVIGVFVGLTSKVPGQVFYWFTVGPLTSLRRIGTVFEIFVPYVFCGMGMMMMLRANKLNMSVDGAFYISMAVTSIIAIKVDLPQGVHQAVCILVGAITGALCCAIPAWTDYKFKANIVVCSLMLNYVVLHVGRYILLYYLKDPSLTYTGSYPFPDDAILHRILRGTALHSGFYFAIIAIVITYFFVKKTTTGYAITQVGNNIEYARACGINVSVIALVSQIFGGILTGVGGAVEVMGTFRQFKSDGLLGYGNYGMLIAVLGRNEPIPVIFAALLIAYLHSGAALINVNTDLTIEYADVLQGLIIIFLAASELLARSKHRWLIKEKEVKEAKNA